jgi:hypothetical protein
MSSQASPRNSSKKRKSKDRGVNKDLIKVRDEENDYELKLTPMPSTVLGTPSPIKAMTI